MGEAPTLELFLYRICENATKQQENFYQGITAIICPTCGKSPRVLHREIGVGTVGVCECFLEAVRMSPLIRNAPRGYGGYWPALDAIRLEVIEADAVAEKPPDLNNEGRERYMSNRHRPGKTERVQQRSYETAGGDAVTVVTQIDPPESGPPEPEELEQQDGSEGTVTDSAGDQSVGQTESSAPEENPPAGPVAPAARDFSSVVANLDGQSEAVWPTAAPFKVDWPWMAESDPVPGDIIGWNWERGEVARVTGVPPVTDPWPYRMTVEIQRMPQSERIAQVFNLDAGVMVPAVAWVTRWNRAYSQVVTNEAGVAIADEAGGVKHVVGSCWMGVVQQNMP